MELPVIDIVAKEIAEKALDDFTYEGKTIREWVDIIAKQKPSQNCIDREEAIKTVLPYADGDLIADDIMRLPQVTPQPFINKPCISEGVCHEDKIQVLDKLRVEIEALNPVDYVSMSSYEGHRGASDMKDDVLQIIDKYEESEG